MKRRKRERGGGHTLEIKAKLHFYHRCSNPRQNKKAKIKETCKNNEIITTIKLRPKKLLALELTFSWSKNIRKKMLITFLKMNFSYITDFQ